MSIIAVKSDTLSNGYDIRYVVVDDSTGEIIDDAHGSGYRTEMKALRCWKFKQSARGREIMEADKVLRRERKTARIQRQQAEKIKKKARAGKEDNGKIKRQCDDGHKNTTETETV